MTFTLAIGDQVTTRQQLDEAPPGTLLKYDPNNGYQKRNDGRWEQVTNRLHHTDVFPEPGNIRLPITVVDLPLEGVPSLQLIKWRIRDGALQAAVERGVSQETAQRVLEASGADADKFPWAADQKVSNATDLQRIPVGSVVHMGRPTDLDKYTVYQVTSPGQFKRLFGPGAAAVASQDQPAVWVDTINGAAPPGTWTDDPPASAKDIATFKKKVWDAGLEAKQRHGWCETYEFVMERLGVTAESGEYHEPVTQEAVLAEPPGVVFSLRDATNNNRWTLYVRVPQGGDEWGLAPLVTSSTGAPRMDHDRLVRLGGYNEACIFTTTTLPDANALPVGTLMEAGRDRYRVERDHRVRGVNRTTRTTDGATAAGSYRLNEFGADCRWTILMFGRFA